MLIVVMAIAALLPGARAHAAAINGGDVGLTVDEAGRVTGLTVSGTAVAEQPAPMLSLCDVTKGTEFADGRVTGGDLTSGMQVTFDGMDADATISAKGGETLHFTMELVGGQELAARGVLLRVSLPVAATGWRWHDDMQTARVIERGSMYENVQALRAWPDLPEWTDKPNLRIGAANRNFCTVLTG
ncbi:MAG TPA: hypothetical protein VM283_04015, partial [Armatimonadota bacterium]|nr:hypothetical protein [Armatimonadota bacterium]